MTLLACLLQAMRERAPETPVPAGLLLAELLCLRSAGSQPGRQPPVYITSTLQAVEERAHDAADYSAQHAQLATEVQQLRASLAQLSADHKATEEQLRRRKAKNMQEVEVGLGAFVAGPLFPCSRVLHLSSHTLLTPPACVRLVQVWIQKYDEDMGVKELEHQEEQTALNEVGHLLL